MYEKLVLDYRDISVYRVPISEDDKIKELMVNSYMLKSEFLYDYITRYSEVNKEYENYVMSNVFKCEEDGVIELTLVTPKTEPIMFFGMSIILDTLDIVIGKDASYGDGYKYILLGNMYEFFRSCGYTINKDILVELILNYKTGKMDISEFVKNFKEWNVQSGSIVLRIINDMFNDEESNKDRSVIRDLVTLLNTTDKAAYIINEVVRKAKSVLDINQSFLSLSHDENVKEFLEKSYYEVRQDIFTLRNMLLSLPINIEELEGPKVLALYKFRDYMTGLIDKVKSKNDEEILNKLSYKDKKRILASCSNINILIGLNGIEASVYRKDSLILASLIDLLTIDREFKEDMEIYLAGDTELYSEETYKYVYEKIIEKYSSLFGKKRLEKFDEILKSVNDKYGRSFDLFGYVKNDFVRRVSPILTLRNEKGANDTNRALYNLKRKLNFLISIKDSERFNKYDKGELAYSTILLIIEYLGIIKSKSLLSEKVFKKILKSFN